MAIDLIYELLHDVKHILPRIISAGMEECKREDGYLGAQSADDVNSLAAPPPDRCQFVCDLFAHWETPEYRDGNATGGLKDNAAYRREDTQRGQTARDRPRATDNISFLRRVRLLVHFKLCHSYGSTLVYYLAYTMTSIVSFEQTPDLRVRHIQPSGHSLWSV